MKASAVLSAFASLRLNMRHKLKPQHHRNLRTVRSPELTRVISGFGAMTKVRELTAETPIAIGAKGR